MEHTLTPGEAALLAEAQRSNGGGIRRTQFNGKVIDRLLEIGLLSHKKGNVTSVELIVVTRRGREYLQAAQEATQRQMVQRNHDVFRNVVEPTVERIEPPTVVIMGGSRAGRTAALRQALAAPYIPFPVHTVIDVECREVGQDDPSCDAPWKE